jgi:RNA polymerase sigma-70 factor (ECF subfamily)
MTTETRIPPAEVTGAYGALVRGSAGDAEEVLQESWLRWAAVDRSQVREPRAYWSAS